MEKNDKNKILNDFLNKKIDVLVSTTVIEVGIDFPNANVIIIENANKYGLSQFINCVDAWVEVIKKLLYFIV